MNSLAGALPMDDAWEDAGAGKLAEDDGGGYDPKDPEKVRVLLERVISHFGIQVMVWLMSETVHEMRFRIQTESDKDARKARKLSGELELALGVEPVTFEDIEDNGSAFCVVVPKL